MKGPADMMISPEAEHRKKRQAGFAVFFMHVYSLLFFISSILYVLGAFNRNMFLWLLLLALDAGAIFLCFRLNEKYGFVREGLLTWNVPFLPAVLLGILLC